jgi:glycosyltransferase involved in cell wall biosynthesis
MRVLMITSEWPSPERPQAVPHIVRQVKFLRRAGLEVDVFLFRGAKNPINYLKAWRRLRDRLRGENYDLVHAQFGQSAFLPWPKRLPLVITFRGDDLQGIAGRNGHSTAAGRLLRTLCPIVARGADAAIVVSEHMRRYLAPSVPIHTIPSGLDFESLSCFPSEEARRQLRLPANERLVLFVGNPAEPGKRHDLAREAVEILNRTLPAQLVVAWGRPPSDIPVFMSACDVLAFTSCQEGSPDVVKEALACNLPIVTGPVGDIPLRLEGVAGCEIYPDDHPKTVAAALERVLRRRERINGRAAVKDLDEAVLTEKVIAVYRSVLAGKQRARRMGR